jgi:UDP-glucose 4-epimerase
MKMFVTGGAGFIGSHLVDRLLAEGHEVTVYDNLSSGKREFLRQHDNDKKFLFIHDDLLDLNFLLHAMKNHDMVWHLAANPDIRAAIHKPDTDLKQGIQSTFNVLEAMRGNGIDKIAFSSSSVVYGEPTVFPTPENYGPLFPISVYGASKLASEGLITSYRHTFDIDAWIFRFANIIGKRSTHGILFDFLEKIKKNPKELEVLGDGKQKKSYLMVQDCVDAMYYCFKKSTKTINVFNLGASDQIQVSRIAELFLEVLELKDCKLRYTGGDRGWKGDVPAMFLDVSKLNRLGWKAKYSSEQAIIQSIPDVSGCKQ